MADFVVTVRQGQLKGTTDTNRDGGKIYKFSGIPYAKPPVGPLRFKAPEPAESWTDVRDATEEGHPCLAIDVMTNKIIGSEDCLYLNVFTKELPKSGQSPKPVMVFIHGGAFTVGSGSEQGQGPKYLLTQDIVLVTINYRLGVFGFLSMDDTSLDVPGNAGLKDQTLALKWIKENISSFNGDPNNITIFGVSAGGVSVHFQVLSPTAKGLFHKAIAQSGSALNPWAWGQKNAIQLAEKLGHAVSNERDALEVLSKVDANELYQAVLKLPDILANSNVRRPFGPVIEKANPTAFLTDNPSDLLASGRFNQVPMIQGLTSNEGLICEFPFLGLNSSEIDPFECGIMWNLGLKEGSEKHAKVKQLIKDFYFKNGVTKEGLHQIIGDAMFMVGIVESIKLALDSSTSPIYSYVFSYDTPMGHLFKKMFQMDGRFEGLAHGADQALLLNSSLVATLEIEVTEEDKQAVNEVVKIWTDFAKTGNPHEQWKPVKHGNFNYFNICKDASLISGPPFAERVALWENIIKVAAGLDASYDDKAKL